MAKTYLRFWPRNQAEFSDESRRIGRPRNIDVECDGDTWHMKSDAAAHDNVRNNFMEQRGWHVLRFGTRQLTDDLPGCVCSVTTLINRCGGLILSDDSVKAIPEARPDGWKQGRLF